MNWTIIANEDIQGSHHADQSRQAHRIPSAEILIVKECRASRRPRTHDPKGNDNSEDAADMETQQNALDQRKLHRQKGVEQDGIEDDRYGDHCAMPASGNVGFIVEGNNTLDNATHHEAYAGKVYLPTDGREPACALLSVFRADMGTGE